MLFSKEKDQIHLIHILYSILYNRDVHFIGELIRDIEFFSKQKEGVKSRTIDIILYLINSDKVIVEKKDSENNILIIYDSSNVNELVDLISNNWDEFSDSNNYKVWYAYQIGYTENWKKELIKIGKWKK